MQSESNADDEPQSNGNRNSHGNSYSHGYCHCYSYSNCHTNAYCNSNSYAYTDPAGYAYSKTSPNPEASPVALIGTVKAGTRETNSRVPRLKAACFRRVGRVTPAFAKATADKPPSAETTKQS